MSIKFKKVENQSVFLDPRNNFEPQTVTSEIRYDPLTGQISRIFPFRAFTPHHHDWTPFVEESKKKFCPFCPEVVEQVTPKFPASITPEGRIKVGDALVVPNLNPYEKHASLVIMTFRHYVSMQEMDTGMMVESFRAGITYLQLTAAADPDGARYASISWNYMPYAGGSLIHPHLQVLAGPEPCTYDKRLIESSAKYLQQYGSNYWEDLIKEEMKRQERYIGCTGKVHWVAAYAPRHVGDIIGIMPGKRTVDDLSDDDLAELAGGLKKIISYYDRNNIASFNAAIYFARNDDEGFTAHARIVGRFTIYPLVGSDITHMQVLHDDPWTVILPEQIAGKLKEAF